MSNNDVTIRRAAIQKQIDEARNVGRGEKPLFSMDTFRDEMQRRGVYDRAEPRIMTPDERAERRAKYVAKKKIAIPDGKPTFGESQLDRAVRLAVTTRKSFFGDIVQAVKARLALLEGRPSTKKQPCPWARVVACTTECRCKGTGEVSVGLLRAHYTRMAEDYRRLA